ncbi:hypothetical protein HMPREF1986_01201 [Oribacterium sp. oral taxon 078 str. F0263]|nr:hypothetical protein HMPREF1986_01201 [Oribacterium sp. oral taxon 078 str. F0263]
MQISLLLYITGKGAPGSHPKNSLTGLQTKMGPAGLRWNPPKSPAASLSPFPPKGTITHTAAICPSENALWPP